MHDVFFPIKGELALLQERMNRHYKIKAGDLKEFVHLQKHINIYICPALVIFSARVCGKITDNVMAFAEMFQLIYVASMIHREVNLDGQIRENNKDPRDGCQYPILVGDYLYSKSFAKLIETGNDRYMGTLSEIVCSINEGGIIRLSNQGAIKPELLRSVIRLEKAELLAGCCEMGARMAGAGREQQQCLYSLGTSLGMAVGMSEVKRFDQAGTYFDKALSLLENLAPGEDREQLKDLVAYMMDSNIESKKMVC